MIFDWIENCKQICETRHFPDSDAQEKKTALFQHITLFKYLEDVKHMTRHQVKEFWLSTDSVYLKNIPEDDNDDWTTIEFNKIWNLRKKNTINFEDFSSAKIYNFPIYKEEIDFINSLECSAWYKKALLLLLGCAKHNKTGLLKLNYTTTAWVEKVIDPKHKRRDKMRNLGLLNARYHLFDSMFDFSHFKQKSNVNWVKVTYRVESGTLATVVYSPNYMSDVLDFVKEDTVVCPGCGKQFVPSSKGQTNYCDTCYVVYRREKDAKRKAISRAKNPSPHPRGRPKNMSAPKSKNVIYE